MESLVGGRSRRRAALLLLGGALHSIGALIYARMRSDPFPCVFGFRELLHLVVSAGSATVAVGVYTLPHIG